MRNPSHLQEYSWNTGFTEPNGDGFFVGKKCIQEKKNEQTLEKTNPWLLLFFKISGPGIGVDILFGLVGCCAFLGFWQENDNRPTWMASWESFESLAFSVSLVVVMLYSVTAIVSLNLVDIYIPHLLQHIMPSYELCHQIVIQKVQVSSLHRPLNSPFLFRPFGQGRQCTLPQNCLHQQPIRSTQVKWSLAENPLRTWEPRAPVSGTHGTHTTPGNGVEDFGGLLMVIQAIRWKTRWHYWMIEGRMAS